MRSTSVIAAYQEPGLAVSQAGGQTLRELLAKGLRPDRGQLIDWGCEILDALAEAHAQGHGHGHVSEDSVAVEPDGRVVLTGLARAANTVQDDLHAVGSLLRRLSFASRLKSGGAVGSNGRDPLLKVIARATFRDPAMRYRNAADMAEALRQAGSVRPRVPVPLPALPAKGAGTSQVVRFPAAPPPQPEAREDGGRGWVLLLLALTLLLMLSAVAAGWLLLDGGTLDPVESSLSTAPSKLELP